FIAAIAISWPSAEMAGAARMAPSLAFHNSAADAPCSFHRPSANSLEDRYKRKSEPKRGDETPAAGTGNGVATDSGEGAAVKGMDQSEPVGLATVATKRRRRSGIGALAAIDEYCSIPMLKRCCSCRSRSIAYSQVPVPFSSAA